MARKVGLVVDLERLEDAGRFDEAFAEIELRHRIQLQQADLAAPEVRAALAGAHARRVQSTIDAFPAQAFALAARSTNSHAPIFIVGMPRSGSTLTEQILSMHTQVQAMDENEGQFGQLVGGGELRWLQPAALTASDLRELAATYLKRLKVLGWNGRSRFTDKFLGNYMNVGLLSLLFPRATFLHCVRDPVDTCFACFRTPLGIFGDTVFCHDLRDVGAYYVRYRRMMDHWAKVLPGRLVEVRLETLVGDFEAQARRLLAACGLPWQDRCLAFHENKREVKTASVSQVRQPINDRSLGRWRSYAEHLGPLMEALGPYAPRRPAGGALRGRSRSDRAP